MNNSEHNFITTEQKEMLGNIMSETKIALDSEKLERDIDEYERWLIEEDKVFTRTYKWTRWMANSASWVSGATASAVVAGLVKEHATGLDSFQSKLGKAVVSVGSVGIGYAVYEVVNRETKEHLTPRPQDIHASIVKRLNKSRKKLGFPELEGSEYAIPGADLVY